MVIIKNRRYNRKAAVLPISVLLVISVILGAAFVRMRDVVFVYARSVAETVMLNAANNAVVEILSDGGISYDDIIELSRNGDGNVTSLEVNIVKINLLKSLISTKVPELVAKGENYGVRIPLGTFFGSEYTMGLGPKINFRVQITTTAFADFENEFTDAGMNQVLHRVMIKMKINANILFAGYTNNFSVSTSAVAAQTVIVGAAPDAFTNVIETPASDVAGLINDYGATN